MSRRNSKCLGGLKIAVMGFATLIAVNSQAEILGSMNGRTAKFSAQPQMSVEATITNGEIFKTDYQQLGARLNYQYAPNILVFGDLGKSELASSSEISFGLGAFYSLNQSIIGSDSALKVSFHKVDFDSVSLKSGGLVQRCTTHTSTVDGLPELTPICHAVPAGSSSSSSSSSFSNIAFELISSGAMPNSALGGSAQWYMNGGIQLLSGGGEDDTIFGFGAGVVLPLAKNEIFVGVEHADELFFGAGFRFQIR